ncbi:hypothetical protein PVAND_004287 [Polypedilum vanderplanki]|uniref:Uncharacterized protein n=1 Tax=Polypedilum vanderplanki TaxID=319348 RepID=A0A9J6BXP4_POLVA|nr:hypothetical protein PVAND_004287 [Polypedilum vanderplanki]
MPIFPHRKFTPKLPKQRELRLNSVPKFTEDIDDFRNIKLKLNAEKEFQFADGVWISLKRNQAETFDDITRIVTANKKLKDENSMFNVKIDIMLDLLTECEAEKDAILRKQNVI